MNETTQYVITAAVFDVARIMATTANRDLSDEEVKTSPKTANDFIPQALASFLEFHQKVQTLLAARPPA